MPIPRTLPISRSRGRTVERTTSTTRLCFSSTTPVSDREPEAEDPDEDQHGADVGEQEARLVRLGLRVEGIDRRRLLGREELGRRDVGVGQQACVRSPTTAAVTSWVTNWSGSLSKRTVPGPDRSAGTATTAATDSSASALAAAAWSGNGTISTSRSSWGRAAVVVIAVESPGGSGWTTPIRVASSSPNRTAGSTKEPDHEQRREQDGQHEPATPAALEDLAPGDQPDASPAAHVAAPATGAGASGSGATASMNSSDSFGGW